MASLAGSLGRAMLAAWHWHGACMTSRLSAKALACLAFDVATCSLRVVVELHGPTVPHDAAGKLGLLALNTDELEAVVSRVRNAFGLGEPSAHR